VSNQLARISSPVLALVAATVALSGCASDGADASRGTTDYSTGTHLVLLGTGTPNADPERSGPAVAVVVEGTSYLVDAGPGVVRRAAAAERLGVEALGPANLRHLFLTHLHSDHTLGLPDVIFSSWTLERRHPLELFGPRGTQQMVDHLLAAYEQDIAVRIEGLEPADTIGYRVNVHEIGPGIVYQDSSVTVTAFAVQHTVWEHAFGYRFETADRVIVISGDAVPGDAVVEQCNGCDILLHEAYSQAGFERREPEWQRYHASSHTSSVELAQIATRARPKLLVLYHQLFWGTTEADLLAEVRAGYDGPVVSGRDLDIF
jgi:ribonuclease BN (tRNA processing enzyme)